MNKIIKNILGSLEIIAFAFLAVVLFDKYDVAYSLKVLIPLGIIVGVHGGLLKGLYARMEKLEQSSSKTADKLAPPSAETELPTKEQENGSVS